MIGSPEIYHLTAFQTLLQVMNLIVLQSFTWNTIKVWLMHSTQHHQQYLLSEILIIQILIIHLRTLLCFIVAISETVITVEYPSIDLVLYSYTPNKELDSWQIVCAHLTSFLKAIGPWAPSIVGLKLTIFGCTHTHTCRWFYPWTHKFSGQNKP